MVDFTLWERETLEHLAQELLAENTRLREALEKERVVAPAESPAPVLPAQ